MQSVSISATELCLSSTSGYLKGTCHPGYNIYEHYIDYIT